MAGLQHVGKPRDDGFQVLILEAGNQVANRQGKFSFRPRQWGWRRIIEKVFHRAVKVTSKLFQRVEAG